MAIFYHRSSTSSLPDVVCIGMGTHSVILCTGDLGCGYDVELERREDRATMQIAMSRGNVSQWTVCGHFGMIEGGNTVIGHINIIPSSFSEYGK